MTGKNRTPALILWVIIWVASLAACGGGSNSSATPNGSGNTGRISFNVNWVDAYHATPATRAVSPDDAARPRGKADCDAMGIDKVLGILYNSSKKEITHKEWSCKEHGGIIDRIPAPQEGVTIILAAKNNDGDIVFRGEKGDLSIEKRTDTTAGEIAVSSFIPLAPEPGDADYTIQWGAVQGAAGYRIEFSTTEDFNAPIEQFCEENSCTAEDLSPDTLYYSRIYARDHLGNEGASSAVGTMTTQPLVIPSGPENVTAEAGDRTVTLNWTADPSPHVVYNVYGSTESGLSKANAPKLAENLDTNTYVHQGLSSDTRYYYIVTSQNAVGEGDPVGEVSAAPGWITLLQKGSTTASALDTSGNLFIYGTTNEPFEGQANVGEEDLLLAKLNVNGEIQWVKLFGTTDDDFSRGMGVDAAGNTYITGLSHGDWYEGHDNPGALIFLLKVDPTGVQEWVRHLPIEYRDSVVSVGLAVDSEGNSYITSTTPSESPNGRDVVIAKYDTGGGNAGEPNWIRYLSSPQADESNAIALDGQGAIYITGETEGDLGGKTNARVGYDDIFVAKYTAADGTRQWVTLMGTQYNEQGQDVAADQDACYITGHWRSDLYVAKINGSDGVLSWDRTVEEADQNYNWTRSIAISSSGNVVVGTIINIASFDGQDNSGTPDTDGGEYPFESLLLAYDANGDRLWSELFGTPDSDFLYNVIADASGYLYLTGGTYGDFGGYPKSGMLDIFAWKRYVGP